MPAARFELETKSYDLSDAADVQRLAEEIGRQWTDILAPLAAAVPQAHRGVFFGFVLAAPVGAMTAAIGVEDAAVIAAALVEAARANRKRAAH